MTYQSRPLLRQALLVAGWLAVVVFFSVSFASNASTGVTAPAYKLKAGLLDCQKEQQQPSGSQLIVKAEVLQAAGSEVQPSCNCPFSSAVQTPFFHSQLIEVLNIQLSSLLLIRDEVLGKTHNISEQPFRPPIT